MIDLKLIAKGGLIVLLTVSVAILVEQLTITWRGGSWDNEFDDEVLPINRTLWPLMNKTEDSIYNENFVRCFQEHVKSSYYPITQGRNISFSCIPSGRCIHNFLIRTTKILESLNLKLILIEPHLLFCMLSAIPKYTLLTRGFIPTRYNGLKNVVTVGVESSQAKILDEAETRERLVSLRYKIMRLAGKRYSKPVNEYISLEPASHYFLIRYDMIMHIIVLYPKETFLFSPGLETEMNTKGLQYVDNRAFENFTTSTSYLDASSTAPILLPSDSRNFLLDVLSSQFKECETSSSDMLSNKNIKALAAVKEMKSVLGSHMAIFWLWSKSLQGWHEKCDVQYYSDELKFSLAAKSVEGFNFPALFANSFCQHSKTYSHATSNIIYIQLNCSDVKVNLIFMYEDRLTYYTEYMDAENIYKLRFPKFTLCSADIYGEKINIPCVTGDILDSEYGQFLKNTTLTLNPDTMPNVMLLTERK